MKKVLSFVIAFVISATTVFADGAGDALMKVFADFSKVTSGEGEYSMSIEVNEPLEVLNTIPLPDEDVDIDLSLIAESLISASTHMSYVYSVSDDFKKLSMEATVSADTPIKFSDSFSMSAYAKIGMWVEYDFTDASKPVYRIVYKLPFYKRYVGIDMSGYFAEHPDEIPEINADVIKKMQDTVLDALASSAEITKKNRNYTVKLDDSGFKKYIMSALDASEELMMSYVKDDTVSEAYDEMIAAVQDFFDKTTVLGEDGMVFDIKVNSKGFIETENVSAHIKLNVFDILEAYSKSTEGLTRENAEVDLTLKANYTFKNHNKSVNSDFPEITEENSNIMKDFGGSQLGYNSEHKYFKIEGTPIFENDEVYYPFEMIAQKCGYEIVREDNKIIVNTNNETIGSVIFDTDSNSVNVNNEEYQTDGLFAIERNGALYFSGSVLHYVNIDIYSGNYDVKTNTFSFNCEVYLPEITQGEEETYIEEYKYVPDTLYFDFYIDRMPELYNGEYYMPVYEFVRALFDGEFTFGEGVITYTAAEENVFGIKEFYAKTDDAYIMINGEPVMLSNPVISVDGVIQIPVSFNEYFGLNMSFFTNYFAGGACETCFNMQIPNPEYKEEDQDDQYQPEHFYYYIFSDKALYMNNQMLYIPVYDMLEEIYEYDGEFVFGDDWMEFTVPENNKTKIPMTKISVKAGDNFVTVDDKEISLSDPVVLIDDVLRVPVSFVSELGLELVYVSFYSTGGTSFDLKLNNPDYKMSDYEEQSLTVENNWFYKLFG